MEGELPNIVIEKNYRSDNNTVGRYLLSAE